MTDPIDELRRLNAAAPAPPASMDAYLAKVHERAYTVTDADVEALKDDGLSEDEIFEYTVASLSARGCGGSTAPTR